MSQGQPSPQSRLNVAMFGGTFDPIHRGHTAVARAALADPRFRLDSVHFIPADLPPHKREQGITPYADRFAMLELALAEEQEERFVASRLEQRTDSAAGPNYSINTVRKMQAELGARLEPNRVESALFFIIGIDAFLDIASWREPEALLTTCRFIIASRPGYSLVDASDALPESLRDSPEPEFFSRFIREHLFLLPTVAADISATQIRAAVAQNQPLEQFVAPTVARYIAHHGLYR